MERQISLQHTEVNVREVAPILEGRLDNLPPISSKMVRVFLSSTFSGKLPSLISACVRDCSCLMGRSVSRLPVKSSWFVLDRR